MESVRKAPKRIQHLTHGKVGPFIFGHAIAFRKCARKVRKLMLLLGRRYFQGRPLWELYSTIKVALSHTSSLKSMNRFLGCLHQNGGKSDSR